MTLILSDIRRQVDDMTAAFESRRRAETQRYELAHAVLNSPAADPAELRRRAEAQMAGDSKWRGALPAGGSDEPLHTALSAPPLPERLTIIAVDGSQIYPDRHHFAAYYLLNIGSFIYRCHSGEAPVASSQAEVHFSDEDLLTDDQPVDTAEVDKRRAIAELQALRGLVVALTTAGEQVIGLSDGPLLPYLPKEDDRRKNKLLLEAYLQEWRQIQQSRAVCAGYVDRPGSNGVLRLLQLADPPAETSFQRLHDRVLFEFLRPGERSRLFKENSQFNNEFSAAGQEIDFFYLNVGSDDDVPVIVRVDLPAWATAAGQVGLLHATLLQQCRLIGGYPYALTRAHELAVVRDEERRAFEELVAIEMLRRGLPVHYSHKQAHKSYLG